MGETWNGKIWHNSGVPNFAIGGALSAVQLFGRVAVLETHTL